MKLKIYLFLNLLIVLSCNKKEIAFNKDSWNIKGDIFYRNRAIMANDLLNNHLKSGMKYSQVICLLGNPENFQDIETNQIVYEISTDYGNDIDPIRGKNLIINFSKDSLVTNFKIENWKAY